MATIYRFQVVLKHISGLPRDNITNTFWISDLGAPMADALVEDCAEAVRDFYVSTPATATKPLISHLGRSIKTEGHEVKVAPIDRATGVDTRGEGFPPLHTEVFDFVGRVVDVNPVPNEVALCLSFKNMSSGAVPPAQRRGRIYFGPVGGSDVVQVNDITVPSAALIGDLLKAGNKLHDDIAALGPFWVVYSRPFAGRGPEDKRRPNGTFYPALPARDGATHTVTDIWVDNAFDTIRKRGERASARSTMVV